MAAMLAPAALPPRGLQSKAVGNAESQLLLHGKGCIVADAIIFAAKSNERRRKSQSISQGPTFISEEASSSGSGENPNTSLEVNANDVTTDEKFTVAPRNAVLQACTLTSSLLLAGGLVLRETWPDFRYSSETANRQILTSLETFDYIVVACLPGISEEVLFRGALMPIFGLNWISAFVTGAIFGILHLGNGRKYSFAIWATFVGVAYGLATIASSSIIHFSQTGGNL
uniref:CAAX prenyl protease 2/Lysostaphin resistance protein A-like domain-containing protein n=1 Tax=Oryza glumipatula TaxID=40148 RepID=A0A0D9ZWV3_9ORYZ